MLAKYLTMCLALVMPIQAHAPLSPATQGSQLLAEVPFTLHQNAVIVKCVVGGRDTVRMLLDTGWGPLALTSSAARRLGLTATSAGGDMVARASSFGIGRALRRDVAFELFPPEALQPLIGPFDGVLSTGFLHDFVVQIDYPRGVVRLFSKMPAAGSGADRPRVRATMPMVFSPAAGFLPFTDSVFVDGQAVRALFDTGGSGAFMAMAQLMSRAALEVLPDTGRRAGIGMFGNGRPKQAPLRFARARSISVGGITRNSPLVIVAPAQLEGANWRHDLIIGYGFLRDFVVTFDYPGHAISLEQRGDRGPGPTP